MSCHRRTDAALEGRSILYVTLGSCALAGESMQLQKQANEQTKKRMEAHFVAVKRCPGDQLEAELRLESVHIKTNARSGRLFSVFDGDQTLSLNSELRFKLVGSIKWLHIQ